MLKCKNWSCGGPHSGGPIPCEWWAIWGAWWAKWPTSLLFKICLAMAATGRRCLTCWPLCPRNILKSTASSGLPSTTEYSILYLCFRIPSVWFVKLAIVTYVLYNLISYSLIDSSDTCKYDMNSFVCRFFNGLFLIINLYIFPVSWKLRRYLKLQNGNWIKFSNWPWCLEKLSNI
jgi:hypothetical protein